MRIIRRRVKLPLVQCAHKAPPGEEMTPERVAEVLLEEEAGPSCADVAHSVFMKRGASPSLPDVK